MSVRRVKSSSVLSPEYRVLSTEKSVPNVRTEKRELWSRKCLHGLSTQHLGLSTQHLLAVNHTEVPR